MLYRQLDYSSPPVPMKQVRQQFFRTIYDFCYREGYSFIAYAHPEDESSVFKDTLSKDRMRRIRILIGKGLCRKSLLNIRDFTSSHPGFIFSPFDTGFKRDMNSFSFFEVLIIIPIDALYPSRAKLSNGMKDYRVKIRYRDSDLVKKIVDQLQDHLINEAMIKVNFTKLEEMYISESGLVGIKNNTVSTSKRDFCRQVKDQVKRLHSFSKKKKYEERFQKIVLSRLQVIALSGSDLISLFFRMLDDFLYSLVNIVSDSKVGTWLGASPEILVKRDEKKIFHTVSLAGTQWLSPPSRNLKGKNPFPDTPLHQVAWTQKEIEEQAVTSRYIIDCFKQIRLREYVEEGPATIRKGDLFHLQSIFTVDLKKYYGESLPYEMISQLHPTPAVGGMPASMAVREIRRIEEHDRRYYAGFLGPVEIDGTIDVYVNLRCMEWLKIRGRFCVGLYAGAGINRFSNPEKEWKETEAKMRWLVKAVREGDKVDENNTRKLRSRKLR